MISINGVFYDVSRFNHPGGKLVLQNLAGQDASAEFKLFHPPGTKIRLKGHPASKAQNKKMLDFFELEKHMRDIGLFKSVDLGGSVIADGEANDLPVDLDDCTQGSRKHN